MKSLLLGVNLKVEVMMISDNMCNICLLLGKTLSYESLDLCNKCYKAVNDKLSEK